MAIKENYAIINLKTLEECWKYTKEWISAGWYITGFHASENEDYESYTLQLEMEKECE